MILQTQARLFGLDLSGAAQDVRAAWASLRRGVTALLHYGTPIRLTLADGTDVLLPREGGGPVPRPSARALTRAVHRGLVPSEDLLLRRDWVMPALAPAERDAAASLDLVTASPFAPNDTVHLHFCQGLPGGGWHVYGVIASRQQLQTWVQTQHGSALASQSPELWVAMGDPARWMPWPGLGGGARVRSARMRAVLASVLLCMCLAVIAAMAITPTLKLREQALQAQADFAAVQSKALVAVQARDALVSHVDRLNAVAQIAGQQVSPLEVLEQVTRHLPDGSFLNQFQMEGLKVRLGGQTDNASNLLRLLADRPGFLEVKSPAAAVRVPGLNRETFTIELLIDPKAFVGASS